MDPITIAAVIGLALFAFGKRREDGKRREETPDVLPKEESKPTTETNWVDEGTKLVKTAAPLVPVVVTAVTIIGGFATVIAAWALLAVGAYVASILLAPEMEWRAFKASLLRNDETSVAMREARSLRVELARAFRSVEAPGLLIWNWRDPKFDMLSRGANQLTLHDRTALFLPPGSLTKPGEYEFAEWFALNVQLAEEYSSYVVDPKTGRTLRTVAEEIDALARMWARGFLTSVRTLVSLTENQGTVPGALEPFETDMGFSPIVGINTGFNAALDSNAELAAKSAGALAGITVWLQRAYGVAGQHYLTQTEPKELAQNVAGVLNQCGIPTVARIDSLIINGKGIKLAPTR